MCLPVPTHSLDELFDGWQSAWAGRDPDAFASVCAPNLHYEDPLTETPLRGAAALGEHAIPLWRAFSGLRIEATGPRIGDGRFASAPLRIVGTHRRSLAGLPASGKTLVLHVVFFCELDHGLLARVRGFYDLYAAGVQLGVLPARGSFGGRALLALRGFGLRSAT